MNRNHPNRNKRLLALQASHAELLNALKILKAAIAHEVIVNGAGFTAGLLAAENGAKIAIARAESLTTNQ